MSAARQGGAVLLGFVRDIQRSGPATALRRFNLAALAEAPASNAFLAMMDIVCPAGGTLDEGIARQAMAEALGDLADAGMDALTAENVREFFLNFVIRSIEGRIIADIGTRGVALPDSVAAVVAMQQQLHDFIDGHTRAELRGHLDNIESVGETELDAVMTKIYEAGFELIAIAGESVE